MNRLTTINSSIVFASYHVHLTLKHSRKLPGTAGDRRHDEITYRTPGCSFYIFCLPFFLCATPTAHIRLAVSTRLAADASARVRGMTLKLSCLVLTGEWEGVLSDLEQNVGGCAALIYLASIFIFFSCSPVCGSLPPPFCARAT